MVKVDYPRSRPSPRAVLDPRAQRKAGDPPRSFFLESSCTNEGLLYMFAKAVAARQITPSFTLAQANRLLDRNMKARFGNRQRNRLDSWWEMINNLRGWVFIERACMKEGRASPGAAKRVLANIEELKVIEAWLYYHPEVLLPLFHPVLIPRPDLIPYDSGRKIRSGIDIRPSTVSQALVVSNDRATVDRFKVALESKRITVLPMDPGRPARERIEQLIGSRQEVTGCDLLLLDNKLMGTTGREMLRFMRSKVFLGLVADISKNKAIAEADFQPGRNPADLFNFFEIYP